jgi:hypothetical protein
MGHHYWVLPSEMLKRKPHVEVSMATRYIVLETSKAPDDVE